MVYFVAAAKAGSFTAAANELGVSKSALGKVDMPAAFGRSVMMPILSNVIRICSSPSPSMIASLTRWMPGLISPFVMEH
ncbi:MAG: LysR family transcriptional regulator [Halomonas sp.]|uniref:helix-turn-helix domain-containing protein n=1 Tax=Halomonas sp. TaxID=1486246 RepID=UPI003F911535